MSELKPYQLVETYHQARHSRIHGWTFSTLAAVCALGGFGAFLSELPIRHQLAIGLWGTSLLMANRAAVASRDANKYTKRVIALEQASEDVHLHQLLRSVQPSLAPLQLPAAVESPSLYDWQQAPDEGVGFIIAGNSGSGKTSVATWLAGLLTQSEPAQVLVLDPHWNDLWQQQGLQAIGHIADIEATIQALLTELDDRCTRKGAGKPLGEPLLIIADEIGACLERFKNPKWIESALRRLGSEGRKFGMTLIAINQSQNTDDLGISGNYRNNYVLILLGAAARTKARLMGKDMMEAIKGMAYPCIVSGACEDSLALHPTHASYTTFKKKGNAPQNLIPIKQLPPTFLSQSQMTPTLEQFSQEFNSPDPRMQLEIAYNLPSATETESLTQTKQLSFELDDLPIELKPVVRVSMKLGGWIKAIDCKRNVNALKSIPTEDIREYFKILAGMRCGTTRGDGESLQYSAFEE